MHEIVAAQMHTSILFEECIAGSKLLRGFSGKVCGFNLTACNSCGAALPAEVVHSHNVFMGFLYGVARGPFPLTISARAPLTYDLLSCARPHRRAHNLPSRDLLAHVLAQRSR